MAQLTQSSFYSVEGTMKRLMDLRLSVRAWSADTEAHVTLGTFLTYQCQSPFSWCHQDYNMKSLPVTDPSTSVRRFK